MGGVRRGARGGSRADGFVRESLALQDLRIARRPGLIYGGDQARGESISNYKDEGSSSSSRVKAQAEKMPNFSLSESGCIDVEWATIADDKIFILP